MGPEIEDVDCNISTDNNNSTGGRSRPQSSSTEVNDASRSASAADAEETVPDAVRIVVDSCNDTAPPAYGGRQNYGYEGTNEEKEEEDVDEQINEGIELTLEEAEESDREAENDTELQQQQQQPVPAADKSCCRGCCSGWKLCWKRCVAETREVFMETKSGVESIYRKRLLCRLCSLKTLTKRLPCINWIPKYRLTHLKGDVVAGLTTGLSVLPQGLAYGQIVELPAQYGLYSAFMGSFVYAIFGTAKDVAVGPSAIVSILTAQYATGRSGVPLDATYAILLALFTGFIQCAMGILQLGFLFSFISFPVLKAFRAAAGITIFMSRIKKWWGLLGVPREFLPQLYWTLKKLPETNLVDFLFGGLCILLLFTFKKLKAMKWKRKFRDLPIHLKIVKKIFWILGAERNIIVVTFASGVVYAMLKSNINISYTGKLPPGIPDFTPPNFTLTVNSTLTKPFSQIASDIGAGFFFVPLVAIIECISIGKALGRKGNYKIDYNQELIAVGISNILCAFVSGHPVTGAFLRSGINFNAGVKTPAAGILAGAVVLIALTVATPILSYIPTCAMAATIMMGAIDVISFHKFGVIWKTKKVDLIPWIVTFVVSLTAGIEYGVFAGVGLSILMVLYSTMKPKMSFSMETEGVAMVTIQPMTGLLYPAVDSVSAKVSKHLVEAKDCKVLKVDLSQCVDTDTSIIQSLKIIHEKCKKRCTKLELHKAQPIVAKVLEKTYLREFLITSERSDQTSVSENGNIVAVTHVAEGDLSFSHL